MAIARKSKSFCAIAGRGASSSCSNPVFTLPERRAVLDEVAVRALSAAVNDPYTAVAVIDRLSASLCKLMGRALPSGFWNLERWCCAKTAY